VLRLFSMNSFLVRAYTRCQEPPSSFFPVPFEIFVAGLFTPLPYIPSRHPSPPPLSSPCDRLFGPCSSAYSRSCPSRSAICVHLFGSPRISWRSYSISASGDFFFGLLVLTKPGLPQGARLSSNRGGYVPHFFYTMDPNLDLPYPPLTRADHL